MAAARSAVFDRATIGGIVATNDSGPRRHRYGTPRDLIIGVEIALADGRIAKAGGRVVKNVAGYDLSRLMCGSFGSLRPSYERDVQAGAAASRIVDAVATLAGRPERRGACRGVRRFDAHALDASSSSRRRHDCSFASKRSPRATERQIAAAAGSCAAHGAAAEVLTGQAEADAWRAHEHGWRARPARS